MNFTLGIDIGTTHCKVIAMDERGGILHQLQSGFTTINSTPGQSEQDAEFVLETTIQLAARVLESVNVRELVGISFSTAMHSVLAVDASGIPLTNAFTWADIRSEEYARELSTSGIAEKLYEVSGVPMHPMLPLCKIIWIRHTMPTIFGIARKFISIKEYIFFRLFGKYVVDHSLAAASGLFNIHTRNWNPEALKIAGISDSRLSTPVPVTHVEKDLKREFKDKLGLRGTIPFIIGSSDGCLANIGSGAFRPGDAAVTVGTSGAVRMVTAKPIADPDQRLFSYPVLKDMYVTGGPINNGGIALKWFSENFLNRSFSTTDDFNWFMEQVRNVSPGAEGIVFLPYLLGERAPHWDAGAKAIFFGLSFNHQREHIMRAMVEGICFALRDVMEAVSGTNGTIERLYASGGFIHSKTWLQLMADVFGKKIYVTGSGDASALGAAMLAFFVVKSLPDLEGFSSSVVTYEPNMDKHELYRQPFKVYQSLYPKTKDLCN